MAETVQLHKAFSLVQERLTKLFDESGVKRSFTVPYVDGEPADAHVAAVGAAAQQVGGLTRNLVTTTHHSEGKGWNSGEGHTVGHPAAKLRETLISKKDENAKAALEAAHAYLMDIKKLRPDEPSVTVSLTQLKLAEQTQAEGMNLQDFGVFIIHLLQNPTQAVSRAHTMNKHGRVHPTLTAPQEEGQQQPPEGEATPAGGGGEASAGGAPTAAPAAPAEAPAAAPAPAPAVQG